MSAHPKFFSQPLRYLQWAHVAKPAIFYSIAVGCIGPILIAVVPPIRERFGDHKRPEIPFTYPIPTSPRNKNLSGYDD